MSVPVFSDKQMFVMRWWCNPDFRRFDGIICDGSVRSGKTMCMSLSFAMWAMCRFDGRSFALCGKTVVSLRRNVLTELIGRMRSMGMTVKEKVSANYMEVTYGGRRNRFYFFGGKDEGSASLIQGITLAGLLLDEVVLMPRSFVDFCQGKPLQVAYRVPHRLPPASCCQAAYLTS